MSAPPPPSDAANGPKRPPLGAQLLRPKPKVNPLVQRKKPIAAKPPVARADPKLRWKREEEEALARLETQRQKNGGWSTQPPVEYKEFPLVTTKRALMEGIRHHIMRLNKVNVKGKGVETSLDITNQDQFPRPVTLHRRDPRQLPAHKLALKEESTPPAAADDPEMERVRREKAEKEAQRALDQAQIAPVAKSASEPKPKQKDKKDKVSTFYGRHTDEQKKQSGIRYEETLPWHLEDAEGKSGVWVGSYIAGLSDVNVAFVIDGGSFRMIPLERYYRFDEKPKFNFLSLDDAENMMKSKKAVRRWAMLDMEKNLAEQERNETRQFLRGKARVKTESATSRAAPKTERQDDYELDMSGDEFQDDDETPGFEADDEESKVAKSRIRREQGAANLFGEGEESKVDEEEREAQLEKLRQKIMGKKTRKNLKKLEHAMDFDDSDGDDNNPFTESSVRTCSYSVRLVLCANVVDRNLSRSQRRRRTRLKRKRMPRRAIPRIPRARLPRELRHPRGSRRPPKPLRRANLSDQARPTCRNLVVTSHPGRRSRSARQLLLLSRAARPPLFLGARRSAVLTAMVRPRPAKRRMEASS